MPVPINHPPMFGTTLHEEHAMAAEILDLDHAGLANLAQATVTASFLPDLDKKILIAEINDYLAQT